MIPTPRPPPLIKFLKKVHHHPPPSNPPTLIRDLIVLSYFESQLVNEKVNTDCITFDATPPVWLEVITRKSPTDKIPFSCNYYFLTLCVTLLYLLLRYYVLPRNKFRVGCNT